MKRRKNADNKLLKLLSGVLAVILVIIVGIFFPADENNDDTATKRYTDYPFCVTFFDVGQGDAALISCGESNILVDGGEAENSSSILKYLENSGIEKLDGYILSHPHSDHIGAASDIIDNIECDYIFTTYFSEFNIPTTKTYESLIDSIYESDAAVELVEAGDTYTFGELEIEIFAPMVESDEYNAMSVVFSASYKDTTVLFTGDTLKSVEAEIIAADYDVEADVIKVAHHGSTTSSSEEFYDAVSPDIAIISCGLDNSYGHPHDEIVSMLKEKEINCYRTDRNGNIHYFGDGNTMTVVTDR